MRWILFILLTLLAEGLFAESWTNAAGHAIEAELIARKGNVLTLKRTDGSRFSISLSALSKASRKQADKKFPAEQPPTHDEVVRKRQEQRLNQLQARKKQRAKNEASSTASE